MCHGVPPDRYMNCGGTYESKYFFNETAQRCDHYWASGCQPYFGFPNFDECRSHCGGSGSSEYYHYYHHYPNHYGNYWEHYDPYWSYYGYYPYYNYGYYHNYPYYSYYPYYGYGASEQLPEQVNQAGLVTFISEKKLIIIVFILFPKNIYCVQIYVRSNETKKSTSLDHR